MLTEIMLDSAGPSSQTDCCAPICCCFSDAPREDDPYREGKRQFKTSLCDAPCADPLCKIIF